MAQGLQSEEPDEPANNVKGEEPLFIKVPGYKNILQDLVGVQQILNNMKESVEVLHEVQKVKERSVKVFLENVERLNAQLDDIDGQFPEIEDMDIHIAEDISQGDIDEEEVIDNAFTDLKGELEGLRSELDQIE
jgi:hypothetical protein